MTQEVSGGGPKDQVCPLELSKVPSPNLGSRRHSSASRPESGRSVGHMSSNKPGKKRANPRDEDEAMLDSNNAAADSSDEEDDDDDEEEESSDDGEEIVEGEEGEEGDDEMRMDGCNAQVEGKLWRASRAPAPRARRRRCRRSSRRCRRRGRLSRRTRR